MVAVVATSGRQLKVSEGDTVQIDRLAAEVGSTVELDRVLVLHTDDGAVFGRPCVEGAKVVAEVVAHTLGKKRDIFKYRRTRRTRRRGGFRPRMTTLRITQISA